MKKESPDERSADRWIFQVQPGRLACNDMQAICLSGNTHTQCSAKRATPDIHSPNLYKDLIVLPRLLRNNVLALVKNINKVICQTLRINISVIDTFFHLFPISLY